MKRMIIMLLAFSLVFVFASCGKSDRKTNSESETQADVLEDKLKLEMSAKHYFLINNCNLDSNKLDEFKQLCKQVLSKEGINAFRFRGDYFDGLLSIHDFYYPGDDRYSLRIEMYNNAYGYYDEATKLEALVAATYIYMDRHNGVKNDKLIEEGANYIYDKMHSGAEIFECEFEGCSISWGEEDGLPVMNVILDQKSW